MGANGGAGYGSNANQGFEFDQQRGGGAPDHPFGSQDGPFSRAPFPPQQDGFSSAPPLSESELADAFASLDFDETTRAALAQRLQGMQPSGSSNRANTDRFGPAPGFNAKRTDSFSSGYNRDPNAFMFSPFSPSDSPVVGGKSDLPQSQSASSSLHLSHRAEEDGEAAGPGNGADR